MTSRRELYAHGEPFGDSCTRRKIDGKGYICGFGGDSSSSDTDYNTNYAYDNRQALGDNAIGATGGSSLTVTTTTNNTATDPGALRAIEKALLANTATTQDALKFAQSTASQTAGASASSANQSLTSALNFASGADALNAQQFNKLIDLGASMFDRNTEAIQNAQSLTAQAYQTATAEKSGSLDNKTILALGVAGAAALAIVALKK